MKKTLVAAALAALALASCESPVRVGDVPTDASGSAPSSAEVRTVKPGDAVAVSYTGTKTDGSVFDATSKHGGEPLSFTVGAGQMIKGFDDGVVGMALGATKTIVIAPEQAYGPKSQLVPMPPELFLKEVEKKVPASMFQETLSQTLPTSMLPAGKTSKGATWDMPDGTRVTVADIQGDNATVTYPNKENPFAGKKIAKGTTGTLPNGAKARVTQVKDGEVTLVYENKESPFAGKTPKAGMTAEFGQYGTIRVAQVTATGAIVEVPNKHPLAGETLTFQVTVTSIK